MCTLNLNQVRDLRKHSEDANSALSKEKSELTDRIANLEKTKKDNESTLKNLRSEAEETIRSLMKEMKVRKNFIFSIKNLKN